jgi:hypothetical protein
LARLAKRKWALLESNPPRNNQPETHRSNGLGEWLELLPIASKDFPMPRKT